MRGRRVIGGMLGALVGVLGVQPTSASAAVDTTPPVLHSVVFSTNAVTAPGEVTLGIDATDDTSVTRTDVRFVEDSSHRVVVATSTQSPLSITRSFAVTAANGRYTVLSLTLRDAAGNWATYSLNGGYGSEPASDVVTHDVDLTGPSFTVSGASDLTPPFLTSIRRVTTAGRAGEASTFEWTASDEHGVARMEAVFDTPQSGHQASTGILSTTGEAGTWSVVAPHAGEWKVRAVALVDGLGNRVVYHPDGSAVIIGGFPRAHDLPMSTLGFSVAPSAVTVGVVERPGRLTVVLPVTLELGALSGVTLRAKPSGLVREVSLSAGAARTIDLPGLPNGVTQSVEVLLHSAWGDSPVTVVSGRPVLSRNVTGTADVTGDAAADVFAINQRGLGADQRVMSYPGTGAGRLRAGSDYLGSGVGGCDSIAATDVLTLGQGDFLCRSDVLGTIPRAGEGVWVTLGLRGWSTMQWVDGGFSLNADAYPDVIAMNAKGELLLYPKTSRDKLLAPTRIGTGWQTMISVISAGDLTGDRRNDIAAVDASGRLWLYPGNGKGGVTARKQIGSGWQSMGALLPLRDLDRDGKTDLGGITPGGDLRLYRGTGTGGVRNGVVIGTGWDRYL